MEEGRELGFRLWGAQEQVGLNDKKRVCGGAFPSILEWLGTMKAQCL